MDKLPITVWITKKNHSANPERSTEKFDVLDAQILEVPGGAKWVNYSHEALDMWGVESVSIREAGLIGFNLNNEAHFKMLVEATGPRRVEYQHIGLDKKSLSPTRKTVSPPSHKRASSVLISDKYHIYADPDIYSGFKIFGPDETTLTIYFSRLSFSDYLF